MPVHLEHGTPEGWAAGCRKDTDCPATHTHGMSCTTAHIRNASGEHRYLRARAQGLTPPQIARAIGIAPAKALHDAHALAAADERITIRNERRYAAPGPAKARPAPKETPEMNTPAPTPADIAKTTKPLTVQPVPDIDVAAAELDHATQKPPRKKPAPPQLSLATFTNGLSQRATREKGAEIREWCRNNGYSRLSDRGTIPQDALAAYAASHPETPGETPVAAQPLAESANDPAPQEDAGDPAIETEAQAEGTPATEDEAMGHPHTTAPDPAGTLPKIGAHVEQLEHKFTTALIDTRQLREDLFGCEITAKSDEGEHASIQVEALPADEFAEALDQTRERVAEIFDIPADVLTEPPVTDAYYAPRPHWADVAIAEDVEKARNIAAPLEPETAHLLEQLTTAHNALTIVLTKRDTEHHAWEKERIRLLALAEARRAHVDELDYALVVAHRRAAAAEDTLNALRRRIEDAALTPRWFRRKVRP